MPSGAPFCTPTFGLYPTNASIPANGGTQDWIDLARGLDFTFFLRSHLMHDARHSLAQEECFMGKAQFLQNSTVIIAIIEILIMFRRLEITILIIIGV